MKSKQQGLVYLVDVGGSSLKANVARTDEALTCFILDQPFVLDLDTSQDFDGILRSFGKLFSRLEAAYLEKTGSSGADAVVEGLGLAFPGPFDYVHLVSYMENLAKYEALYGKPLEEPLKKTLQASQKSLRLSSPIRIFAQNDARVFTLGAWVLDGEKTYKRIGGFTLGTGCGSGFIYDGRWLCDEPDALFNSIGLPVDGYVYPLDLAGQRTDDVLSARGLLDLAKKEGLDINKAIDLKLLGDQASPAALKVYADFGSYLEKLLFENLKDYPLDRAYLGGRIAGSFSWMKEGFGRKDHIDKIQPVYRTSEAVLVGLRKMLILKGG